MKKLNNDRTKLFTPSWMPQLVDIITIRSLIGGGC